MQHDAHVRDWAAPRIVFHVELVCGGHVKVIANRGMKGPQLVWAIERCIETTREALRRPWETSK